METNIRRSPRPQMHYASTEQLGVLTRWCRDGAATLDPGPELNKFDHRRRSSLNALASLIHLWDLGPEYERLRKDALGKDLVHISDALCQELARHARLRGLVDRGCESPVPLTGMGMEALARLSWGQNMNELAASMRVGKNSLSGLLVRAKDATGTVTTYELLACVYRNGWLPDTQELATLAAYGTSQLDLFDGDRARRYGESA